MIEYVKPNGHKGGIIIYSREIASRAQEEFCEANNLPMFAPTSGICPNCGVNLYGRHGYSVQEAASALVSGCPQCHHSFVD